MPRAAQKIVDPEVKKSPPLSLMAHPGDGGIATRKIAVLIAEGMDATALDSLQAELTKAGAVTRFLGVRLGSYKSAIGGTVEADATLEPSLYLSGNVLDAPGLKREVAQRQRIGLASEFLDRRTLRHHFGIDRPAALLNHGNAEANPVQLAAGYLRLAMKAGAQFHAPHDVVDIECNRQGTTLLTHDGIHIHARHVIFCTGYELVKIVPATNNKILSTWAIATRPQPQAIWPQKALIWEASEPYLYMRASTDGRVICGGEDEDIADTQKRDALTRRKTKRIEMKLHRPMPEIDSQAVVSWTGSFGGSSNGMPTIGAIPHYPRCYTVMGYGGNGITFSMLATKMITAAVLGKKLPDANLFAFK